MTTRLERSKQTFLFISVFFHYLFLLGSANAQVVYQNEHVAERYIFEIKLLLLDEIMLNEPYFSDYGKVLEFFPKMDFFNFRMLKCSGFEENMIFIEVAQPDKERPRYTNTPFIVCFLDFPNSDRPQSYRLAGFVKNDFFLFIQMIKRLDQGLNYRVRNYSSFNRYFSVEGLDCECLFESLKQYKKNKAYFPCLLSNLLYDHNKYSSYSFDRSVEYDSRKTIQINLKKSMGILIRSEQER